MAEFSIPYRIMYVYIYRPLKPQLQRSGITFLVHPVQATVAQREPLPKEKARRRAPAPLEAQQFHRGYVLYKGNSRRAAVPVRIRACT